MSLGPAKVAHVAAQHKHLRWGQMDRHNYEAGCGKIKRGQWQRNLPQDPDQLAQCYGPSLSDEAVKRTLSYIGVACHSAVGQTATGGGAEAVTVTRRWPEQTATGGGAAAWLGRGTNVPPPLGVVAVPPPLTVRRRRRGQRLSPGTAAWR